MADKVDYSSYELLIVDDDKDIIGLLTTWLEKVGFRISTAESGEDALKMISRNKPRLIITDLYMDGMSGLQLLSAIHADDPLLPVIMLSGQAQIPDAIKATHLGCSAFLTKPVDKEVLIDQIKQTLRLTRQSVPGVDFAKDIIYQSDEMAELLDLVAAIADTNVTVFISGATGTGKEIIAKAIHDASSRRGKPFIAVNCGAIPEHLLESELFGHEKGAFTGASTRHEGLFQAAHGGTIFLDEIGDMPLQLQVKLLRVLQDLHVRPVGSVKNFPIDVRVISATHRDLDEAVKDGEFREDLYYRLKVIPIKMPTLAERSNDIPLLAEYFLEKHAKNNNKKKQKFAPDAIEYLVSLSWPGNIRQLINAVELCATLCKTETIPKSLLMKVLEEGPQEIQTLKEVKTACEKNYLVSVLRITGGNVANAARIAGRNRTELYKLLNQHDLDPAAFRNKQ